MTGQRIHVFITGKVQGVYFRKSMKTKAEQNRVNGWVKNLKDGRVEAVIEGESKNVDLTLEWCHGGPGGSVVEDVVVHKEEYGAEFDSFEIIY